MLILGQWSLYAIFHNHTQNFESDLLAESLVNFAPGITCVNLREVLLKQLNTRILSANFKYFMCVRVCVSIINFSIIIDVKTMLKEMSLSIREKVFAMPRVWYLKYRCPNVVARSFRVAHTKITWPGGFIFRKIAYPVNNKLRKKKKNSQGDLPCE